MAKILVIDDDITVQLVLVHLLEREGHQVNTATDGATGMQLAKQQHPDAIVCDWMMPGLDGLEVCRQVNADPDLATTFFILLTAREDVGDRVKGLDAGADEFLSKPIEAEELLARMRAGLRSRRLTQQVAHTNQYLAALVEVQNLLLACSGHCILYNQAIATLGKVFGASQVYVCRLSFDSEGNLKPLLQGEWCETNSCETSEKLSPPTLIETQLFPSWLEMLEKGQIITGKVAELPESEQEVLQALGISAVLILPLIVDDQLFGWINFEFKHQDYSFNSSEIEILRAAAAAFSLHFDRCLTEEELRKSEAHYRAIVEDQTELICRFAPDGKLTFVNEAYCRYFGISRAEALNNSLVPFIPDLKRDIMQYPVMIHESRIVLNNGKNRWLQWSDRAIFDHQGILLGFQAVAQDITERKRAEEETIKALQKEKELSELRSRFVSMVSHEFRNPLSSIISAADLLEYYIETASTEKKLQYIERIQNASTTMNELLEDVLVIGRHEANKVVFQPTEINLIEFGQKIIKEIEFSLNRANQIIFKYQAYLDSDKNDLNHNICGFLDEKLLRQILSNLLSNAIKYSANNALIYLDLIGRDSEVIFMVKDSGIGIPSDDLPHLFESFHRCQNVGMISGTGLGLTIVKRSVDMHGGQIFVESEVGVGTTFTVTLPLQL
ncbi:ATP-binding protein [Planktothricoides raciborskii]|uniref:histidine kinase n=1 Tax=Planktothricoides raciborskii FACHB-1370 TaxID=2949576 RepID=A0ABR8ED01_9CYAN|nr:ATP-binding protein [Planktothricoides raciborskii]MBD2544653.1 response regulator [Planktothricoides raciborskii FACHB-1370]MBD2580738.1 response regulator [Planktothricoides raciborskii FACHB-1261]